MAPFGWTALLAVAAVCGSYYIAAEASDLLPHALNPPPKRNNDAGGVTSTISDNADEQDGNDDAGVGMQSFSANKPPRTDRAPKVRVEPGEKKYKQAIQRWRRSPCTDCSGNTATTNASATEEGDEEEADDIPQSTYRSAVASLTRHLRSLPVAQEKAMPLEKTATGESKVYIHVETKVLSIVRVNDVQQTVKSGLYVILYWHDEALSWNESNHHGVKTVTISPQAIWTPEVFIANSMEPEDLLHETKTVTVMQTGAVYAQIPVFTETICALDLARYPYDEQSCMIKIMSLAPSLQWSVAQEAYDEALASSLAMNSEWELVNVSARVSGDSSEVPSPEIVVTLRRRTMFYTVCLVLPMVVTSYLNTLVFLVPLESGEKVSYLVTLYVSASVFSSFFVSMMPRGLEKMPVSMKLLIGAVMESILVLPVTLLILRRFHAEQEASEGLHTNNGKDARSSGDTDAWTKHHDADPDSKDSHFPPGHPQRPLPDLDFDTAQRLPSRSPRVAPALQLRAARAHRLWPGGQLTSRQLDMIMFVVFIVGNTIFLLVLLFEIIA